jgi:hypothetical protein
VDGLLHCGNRSFDVTPARLGATRAADDQTRTGDATASRSPPIRARPNLERFLRWSFATSRAVTLIASACV